METNDMSILLEELVQRAKCNYISDLHNGGYAQSVADAARAIQPGAYSLAAWQETIQYITGEAYQAQSAEDAALWLAEKLFSTKVDA